MTTNTTNTTNTTKISKISTEDSIVITGQVYDLLNSDFAEGITIAVYKLDKVQNSSLDNFALLKSANVDSQGTYYIVLYKEDIPVDGFFTLTFSAFQSGRQLKLEKKIELHFDNFINKQILQDISLYTLPIRKIKGNLRRKNNTSAVGCYVELISQKDDIVLDSSLTDTKGNYELSYIPATEQFSESQKENLTSLYLRYYNNEDISKITKLEDITITPDPYSKTSYPIEKSSEVGDEINDLIPMIDTADGKEYYYIVKKSNDILVRQLLYMKDELSEDKKDYWRIINDKMILDKRVIFKKNSSHTELEDGKSRIILSKEYKGEKSPLTGKIILRQNTQSIVENKNIEPTKPDNNNLYIKELEHYRVSTSPTFITAKDVEVVNFKFTKDTLDLYTKLTNREIEYKKILEETVSL